MYDAGFVSRRKGVGDLFRYPNQLRQSHASGADQLPQGPADDALHHDKHKPALVANLVDGNDVWMIQRRRRLRFARQTAPGILAGDWERRQYLDGDGAIQAGVPSLINPAHSTGADFRPDFVMPQSAPRLQLGRFGERLLHLLPKRRIRAVFLQIALARLAVQFRCGLGDVVHLPRLRAAVHWFCDCILTAAIQRTGARASYTGRGAPNESTT